MLVQAAEKIKRLDIGIIPVRENDRLVGMITDGDIAVRAVTEGRDPKKTRVREAMSRDICWNTSSPGPAPSEESRPQVPSTLWSS